MKNFKVFKKPVSILAVVIVISMAVVSGQYLSSVDGDDTSKVNGTSNNTSTSNQYQDSLNKSSSTVQSSSSDVQTYDTSGDVQDTTTTTTTTTTSSGGNGKNKS